MSQSGYMKNFQNILEPGHIPSMTKEYRPKIAQVFEKYLTPDELKKYVLKRPKLQNIIERYAKLNNHHKKDVEKLAKEILDEIGLARSLPVIRWLGMCITAVAKRISSGIYVNEYNLGRVKNSLGQQPILYLPSHRSYCDFILMSYICFHYDIEIPGIAAGMDFHSMVGMGNLLRKTGAFFMRRSFSGDDFYWDVFREYMHSLVTVYHIGVEFFIEGTRSRNFKALTPKIGLLSMALQPLFLGEIPDVMIVPVSVSYERLLEEQLFVYELLGVPKPKETTKGFLKALKIIEQRFGRMYIDFGEPISAKEFFGNKLDRIRHANISGHLQKLDKEELVSIKELASEVVYQQQRRIVITTFNLIVVYYAYKLYSGHKISLEQLSNGVLLLKPLFEHLGALIATDEKNIKMNIIETLEIHSNILNLPPANSKIEFVRPKIQIDTIDLKRLKGHKLNEFVMQLAVPALSLQLYINPCMFWLANPSIMVLIAKKLTDETNGIVQKDQLRIRIKELNKIFANEFVIIANRFEEEFEKNFETLVFFKIFDITDRIRFNSNEIADILLSLIAPFLCCYLQVIETLRSFENNEFTEKDLSIAVQKRIEDLLMARALYTHSYCLSLDNISIALSSFIQNSYVFKSRNSITNDSNAATVLPTAYVCNQNDLGRLKNTFLQYCQLLPFSFYDINFDSIISKL